MKKINLSILICIPLLLLTSASAMGAQKAPFPYVWGTAYHVLPGTHNNESGYFSLCEGLDRKIYIGAAYYGENSYLIQLDPVTGKQQIVIDTNKLCGLTATGYAAQAKIHTKNFVGPSGKIYVGSKQGYQLEGDTSQYPGGYVMTYDPSTGNAENLGMPYPGEGVIDVVADEARGLIYIVTCEGQHWMLYNMKTKTYRELGPLLTPYASTIIDSKGRAHAIIGGKSTADPDISDFRLATYDPENDTVLTRPIVIGKQHLQRETNLDIPIWVSAKDKKTVYFTMLNDPTLLSINLLAKSTTVYAADRGRMIEGKNCYSWNGLSMGPDGSLIACYRVDNETDFGGPYLHYLTRYTPRTGKHENLGVVAVKNPDFVDWSPLADGTPKPWYHGFQTLPDGVLAPLHIHQSLIVAADGTVYMTVLYPFTVLRINMQNGKAK